MKKLILIIFVLIGFLSYGQREVDADAVLVRDSLKLNTDWFKLITPINGQVISRVNGVWTNATNSLSMPVDSIEFDSTTVTPISKYTIYADTVDRTLSVNLGNDVILQIGQETQVQVYNNSGATISNGKVCYGTGINGSAITIDTAGHSGRYTALLMATEDIANSSYGLCVELAGKVRGLNTSGISTGPVYLNSEGDLTNSVGVFPYYNYPLGACLVSDASDGVIQFRSDATDFNNTLRNAFNGSFREGFDFEITSNGTVITGSLQSKTDGDLTEIWSDGYDDLDCTPAQTVTLTVGTDANEQLQYVYILKSTGNLTVSTAYWPTTEHIPVAVVTLQSAATTQETGASRNQNINNHLADSDLMGRFDHMSKRIRTMGCEYESGIDLTINGSGTDSVYINTTGGEAWQMHLQTFEVLNMSTDSIKAINEFTNPGIWIDDFADITTDASGSTLNNKYFSVVVWGVQNSGSEQDHYVLNMPTGSYNSSADAIADADGYSVYTIPADYRGVGFLLYRITFQATSTATIWTHQNTEDLRGQIPNATAGGGGGGGGGGVTTFLGLTDVPASYSGQAHTFPKTAAAENALEFSTVTETSGALAAVTTIDASGQIDGANFVSDVATGTAPYAATSTTLNTNLNADLLDSQQGSYYLDLANSTGDTDDVTEGATNLYNQTHTGEVTGSVALTVADGVIDEPNLDVSNAPTDNYLLSYNLAGTNFTWVAQAGGGDMNTSTYDPAGIAEQLVGLNTAQTLTNKTLTTPTIGDFTNATHDHSDAANGGDLGAGIVDEAVLDVSNAPTDNYLLSYNLAGTNFTWVAETTESYISDLVLSNNTLTSTGVGSAKNGAVSTAIANIGFANVFTQDQEIQLTSPELILDDASGTGNGIIRFHNDGVANGLISANSSTGDMQMQAIAGGSAKLAVSTTTKDVKVDANGTYMGDLDAKTSETDVLYYDATSDEVTYGAAPGGSVSFGLDNEIPYTNATTDDFDYSSAFTFNGTNLTVSSSTTNVGTFTNSSTNANARGLIATSSAGGSGSAGLAGTNNSSTTSLHYGGDFSAALGSNGVGVKASGNMADFRAGNSGMIQGLEVASGQTPPTGYGNIYFKTDGKAYAKDDAGTEYDLTQSGGSTDYISDLSLTNNTLTSTGVGSAFNSTVGNIANITTANIFTANQTINKANPQFYMDDVGGAGNAIIYFQEDDVNKGLISYNSSGEDIAITANDGARIGVVSSSRDFEVTGTGHFIGALDSDSQTEVLTYNTGTGEIGYKTEASGSVSFGLDNQIPYTNSTTDDFDYSADLTYDGTNFIIGSTGSPATGALRVAGGSATGVRGNSTARGVQGDVTASAGGAGSYGVYGVNQNTAPSSFYYGGSFQAVSGSYGIGVSGGGSLYDMWAATSGVIMIKEASTFATPQIDNGILYPKNDGKLYWKDHDGTEYDLTQSGGGSPGGSDTQIQYNNSSSFGGFGAFDGTTVSFDEDDNISLLNASNTDYDYINFIANAADTFGIYAAATKTGTTEKIIEWDLVNNLGSFDGAIRIVPVSSISGSATQGHTYFDTDEKGIGVVQDASNTVYIHGTDRQALTSSTTITFDWDVGNNATLTLAHNTTLTFNDIPDNGKGSIVVTQDATGSRTMAFAESITAITSIIYSGGLSTINPTATEVTKIEYEAIGSILFVDVIYYE